jgi:hypothetical protein
MWQRKTSATIPLIVFLQLRLYVLPAVSTTMPALGQMPIGRITPDLVRAWYLALRTHKSPSTAAKACTRLRQIMA